MPETPTSAALAQTTHSTVATVGPTEPQLVGLDSPLVAALPIVSTPETRGGPFGRLACGRCAAEFLSSRANLRCPRCGGTATGASLEQAFGTGRAERKGA